MSAPGMTRVFDDRGLVVRNWLSVAVLVAAFLWGIVELVRAQAAVSDQTGFLFGLGFIAASAYGLYRLLSDSRDAIMRFDADYGSGQSVTTLWRPWGPSRLEAPLAALSSSWRLYVAMKKRNQPTFLLQVNHPGNPRPLHIELTSATKGLEDLRRLAPEAIEDFEIRTGKRKAG